MNTDETSDKESSNQEPTASERYCPCCGEVVRRKDRWCPHCDEEL